MTRPDAAWQPALTWSPELLLRAQGPTGTIRLAVFDVDGVLTDGRLFIGEQGEIVKAFHVLDGQGLKLLQRAGIEPVIITGRDSAALRRRISDLGLIHLRCGVSDKRAEAQQLLDKLNVAWSEVAAMGDDWPDLPLLTQAGFACAPPNAHVEVRAVAHHVTQAGGGEGAAREFCDLLLVAKGCYAALLRGHLSTLDSA